MRALKTRWASNPLCSAIRKPRERGRRPLGWSPARTCLGRSCVSRSGPADGFRAARLEEAVPSCARDVASHTIRRPLWPVATQTRDAVRGRLGYAAALAPTWRCVGRAAGSYPFIHARTRSTVSALGSLPPRSSNTNVGSPTHCFPKPVAVKPWARMKSSISVRNSSFKLMTWSIIGANLAGQGGTVWCA